jgi:hypothetical protein
VVGERRRQDQRRRLLPRLEPGVKNAFLGQGVRLQPTLHFEEIRAHRGKITAAGGDEVVQALHDHAMVILQDLEQPCVCGTRGVHAPRDFAGTVEKMLGQLRRRHRGCLASHHASSFSSSGTGCSPSD